MTMKLTLMLTGLLVLFLASGPVSGAECCTAPANSEGSVDLPVPGCAWISEADTLIARTRDGSGHVNSSFQIDSFFDITYDVREPDGSQNVSFKAELTLGMIGSSGLDGFAREIRLPVQIIVRNGPKTSTADGGSWDTEMVALSLTSSLMGDPDFDLLTIEAGSSLGLAAHGHVTLIKRASGDFQVDSFFDITYQIDYVGAPGSVLEGMSGRTVGTVRITTCLSPNDQIKVVKFRQAPLDGAPMDGADFPYYGHDELSTAYSWYDFRGGGTGNEIKGYRGCFVADDFADKLDKPVVCVEWWGSYLDNEIIQRVTRFVIVFEEDVPADPTMGFSHPGKVLSSEIVYLSSVTDPAALSPGRYSETLGSPGGSPCNEMLYSYVAVLANPFPQKPDTVYWIKIVALVDLPPHVAGEIEGCLDNSATGPLTLCEFLHLPREQRQEICPNLEPITRWGWHNRDYRVFNSDASGAVMPGEQNQRDMLGFPFPTDVWHFQDDAVSGGVFIDVNQLLDPDLCPDCPLVQQSGYRPENYVYDKLCQQAGAVMGVDGPKGIELFSKDLAFVLFTTEEKPDKDCNKNGVPDKIDIANGTSDDCNGNGIPDECENDCNCNGVDDKDDIANGTSKDCNMNGIPDECEDDCNGNGIPDDCDIANGTSRDCNGNGIPDECEPDCNGNDIPDDCDIASGHSDDDNNNGIPDECEPPCPKPLVFRCVAGRADNFDTTDGSEPTSPSLYLLNNPGYCTSGGFTQFDILPTNTCFIHTFDNCCWPANWQVVGAKLEICLRGGPYIPWTDGMHFRQNGTNLWGIRLNDLISWKTLGADTFWDRGQTECFELDLGNLPLGGTDILSDLQAGFLDVVVSDDTGVDYMILTVTVCPCPAQASNVYPGGIKDNYVAPSEIATPGPILQTFMNCARGAKNFDPSNADRCFGHTFTGISPNLLSATLEIGFKPIRGNGATCNDTISIQATTLGPPNFAWGRRLGTGGPFSWCAGAPGIYGASPWIFGPAPAGPLTLNLAALPNADGSTTCLIPQLIEDGRLDVMIADDTAVDYMILRTTTCCRKIVRKLGPGDVNGDSVINFKDIAEVAWRWGEDLRPVNADDPSDPLPPPSP